MPDPSHNHHHDLDPHEASQESIAQGYEEEDVSLPIIARWAGYLIVFTLIVSAVVMGIYYLYVPRQSARSGYTWDSAARQVDSNIPLIQAKPIQDIQKLRTDEYLKENEYAHWTDGDGKRALRIKLSTAMGIIKQRGVLPTAGPAPKMGVSNAPSTPSNVTPAASTPTTSSAPMMSPVESVPPAMSPGGNAPIPPTSGAPTPAGGMQQQPSVTTPSTGTGAPKTGPVTPGQ